MTAGGSRLRQVGWLVVLAICFLAVVLLWAQVNAVKGAVNAAEKKIVALEAETIELETEFQVRSNQQQLANWNRIDFGYRPPTAAQYLDHERELVALGAPQGPGAPQPIRVARSDVTPQDDGILAMVSPLTGRSESDSGNSAANEQADGAADLDLATRLGMEPELGNGSGGGE
ncbi:MAG: hypothetical protein WA954_07625 [Parerythrobacter sp.]